MCEWTLEVGKAIRSQDRVETDKRGCGLHRPSPGSFVCLCGELFLRVPRANGQCFLVEYLLQRIMVWFLLFYSDSLCSKRQH